MGHIGQGGSTEAAREPCPTMYKRIELTGELAAWRKKQCLGSPSQLMVIYHRSQESETLKPDQYSLDFMLYRFDFDVGGIFSRGN
jgi:hypothetical protein